MSDWCVSDDISITPQMHSISSDLGISRVTYCNPKGTNSECYQEDVKVNLESVSRAIHLVQDVQLAADMLQQAHHKNCPARVAHSSRMGPW